MEVSRFINEQPVSAIPPMEVANEGVIRIIREVRSSAILARLSTPPAGIAPPYGSLRSREETP